MVSTNMESDQPRTGTDSIMYHHRLTGAGAGVEKYDIITALAVSGLAAGGSKQTSMMRLIALLSARYNWTNDEVIIGQKEMASLWAVDERTAKRETRRLIEAGLLKIKRPGIRGRVASYYFDRRALYQQSEAYWGNVGPDYADRMVKRQAPQDVQAPLLNISSGTEIQQSEIEKKSSDTVHPWTQTLARLALDQPVIYQAWFHQLHADMPDDEGCLLVRAPTRFVASYVTRRLVSSIEQVARLHYRQHLRCVVIAD